MAKVAGLWMLIAVVTLFPSVALAQNFYLSLRGGPGFTDDTLDGPKILTREELEFDTGFTGGAAVGYAWAMGLRAEAEFGLIYAPVKSDGGVPIDGELMNYLIMANAFYDFKFFGPIKPYVGFGVGAAFIHEDRSIFAERLGRFFHLEEEREAFAWQGRAGVAYELNRMFDVSLGYRFVHIDGGERSPGGFKVETDALHNHSVELGVTFKF
jgi:opacity protein-like surface antigen